MRWTDLSGLRGKKDKWDDPRNHMGAMYALGLEEAEMDVQQILGSMLIIIVTSNL